MAQPAKRGHGQEAAAPSLAARDAPAGVASALLHRFHPERQHEDNDLDGVMGALKAAGPGRGQGRPGPQPCPPGVSCQKPPFPEACPLLMGTHLAPVREKEAEARTPAPQRGGCELRDEQLSRVQGGAGGARPGSKGPESPSGFVPVPFFPLLSPSSLLLLLFLPLLFSTKTPNWRLCGPGL